MCIPQAFTTVVCSLQRLVALHFAHYPPFRLQATVFTLYLDVSIKTKCFLIELNPKNPLLRLT